MSIISTKIPFKGTSKKYVGTYIMKIVTIVKSINFVQLTRNTVKIYNHTSNKCINETSPSTYLTWIPKQKKQNEAVIVIGIACLKSLVQQRDKIKEHIDTIIFEENFSF